MSIVPAWWETVTLLQEVLNLLENQWPSQFGEKNVQSTFYASPTLLTLVISSQSLRSGCNYTDLSKANLKFHGTSEYRRDFKNYWHSNYRPREFWKSMMVPAAFLGDAWFISINEGHLVQVATER